MIDLARDTAKFLPHPICTGCDYNKFGPNFLLMLKSKRARYYAKKDYAKMDSKLTLALLLVVQSVQHDAWRYCR
ncbi:hypothetical protein GCM10027424_14350 [Psychrobacter pacificensis]|jgi:tryptophan synthase beta subunit|uniref:Uncharacterized protein n=1 Tax=Psychrobacter pacificensis TaxID=112002 RepID=A0A1G6ZHK8_9GAMM|nr:hypothetical protein GCM10007915_01220 [Psychrobacter pacificensis]SDE02194.1 hypothetical protein SAMN05660405_02067 [Psychrobacter pacificensis]